MIPLLDNNNNITYIDTSNSNNNYCYYYSSQTRHHFRSHKIITSTCHSFISTNFVLVVGVSKVMNIITNLINCIQQDEVNNYAQYILTTPLLIRQV